MMMVAVIDQVDIRISDVLCCITVVAAAVVEFQVDQLIFQLQFLSGVSGLNAALHSCVFYRHGDDITIKAGGTKVSVCVCVRACARVCVRACVCHC